MYIPYLPALHPKRMTVRRRPRILAIQPRKAQIDDHDAIHLVDDISSIHDRDVARQPQIARVRREIEPPRVRAAFEPRARRAPRHAGIGVGEAREIRVARGADGVARVAFGLRDLAPVLAVVPELRAISTCHALDGHARTARMLARHSPCTPSR